MATDFQTEEEKKKKLPRIGNFITAAQQNEEAMVGAPEFDPLNPQIDPSLVSRVPGMDKVSMGDAPVLPPVDFNAQGRVDGTQAYPFNQPEQPAIPQGTVSQPAIEGSTAATSSAPQEETATPSIQDFVNPAGSGLSDAQFGGLSQNAQQAIQPAPEGTPTISATPEEGLVPMWTPTGTVYADPDTAMQANAAEGQARIEDKNAMVRFQQSPEGRDFSSRQLRSAIMGDGQYGRDSDARSNSIQFRRDQPGGLDLSQPVSDRERRGTGEMSMADAVELAGGDRKEARAMIVRQRQGLDPMTGEQMETASQVEPELSSREKRVQTLQDELGLSPAQAVSIVEGVEKIITDPTTGSTVVYNEATGESRPIDLDPSLTQDAEAMQTSEGDSKNPSTSLYDMAIESTGILPSLKTAAQKLAGQAGVTVSDAPEIANMRQNIDIAKRQLIRALSVNPRYPVSEQEAISKEINITPSAWQDPITIEAQLRAVDEGLKTRWEDEVEAANNSKLPRATRQAALQSANDIQNFLQILGVPEEGEESESMSDEDQALLNKYL